MAYSSQRERITQYIQDTYGTQAEYLWADSPGNAIFRHSASKKWYAAMMRVLPEKLGLAKGLPQHHYDRFPARHKRVSPGIPHE